MKNRYKFAKMLYQDYVILILKNKKLYTYDNNILIDFKYINKLKKLHINYVILDNLDIIKKEYSDNKYLEYYLKYKLKEILKIIYNKKKEGLIL